MDKHINFCLLLVSVLCKESDFDNWTTAKWVKKRWTEVCVCMYVCVYVCVCVCMCVCTCVRMCIHNIVILCIFAGS